MPEDDRPEDVHHKFTVSDSREKRVEGGGLALHELSIAIHRVVADVALGVAGDVEEFVEALQGAVEKTAPLAALKLRRASAVKVDHLADIGVIESAKRDARNEVLIVYKTKRFRAEQVIVVAAKPEEADARLAERVDTADRADGRAGPHREGGAGKDCERAAETVAS